MQPLYPTPSLVAAEWIAQRVPGFAPAMVGTELPRDPATWAEMGFVQVSADPGGSIDIDVHTRQTIATVDLWAASVSPSVKPRWGLAAQLFERLQAALEVQVYGAPLALPAGYLGARVQAAYIVGDAIRLDGDPSGYAHISTALAITWVRAS